MDESYSIHHPDNVEMVGGLAHSYTEQAFTVNASSNCSSDPLAAHCWGNVDIDPDPDPNFCPSQNMNISFRVQGTDPGNQNINYEFYGPSFSYYLPAGNYKLVLDITHCYAGYISLVAGVMHLHNCTYIVNSNPVINHYVGGLRIKSIVSNDNITGVTTKKTYDYTFGGDGGFSSGSIPSVGEIFDIRVFLSSRKIACWQQNI